MGRYGAIECLRIVAAFGIVWFHSKAHGASVGYGGLPAFMILSVAFASQETRCDWRTIVSARVRRMGAPWVFWSLVYLALGFAKSMLTGHAYSLSLNPAAFLIGGYVHLWYLPFGLLSTTIVSVAVCRNPIQLFGTVWWMALLTIPAVIVFASVLLADTHLEPPFAQWTFIIPAIPIGLLFGACPIASREAARVGGLASVAVMLGLCAALALRSDGLLASYTVGTLACVVGWVLPWRAGARLASFAGLSLGIYIVHPIFLAVLSKVHDGISPEVGAVFSFIFSAAAVAILKRTPVRRFL